MSFYCTGLKKYKKQTSSRNKILNSVIVGPFQVLLLTKTKKYMFCCNTCGKVSTGKKNGSDTLLCFFDVFCSSGSW